MSEATYSHPRKTISMQNVAFFWIFSSTTAGIQETPPFHSHRTTELHGRLSSLECQGQENPDGKEDKCLSVVTFCHHPSSVSHRDSHPVFMAKSQDDLSATVSSGRGGRASESGPEGQDLILSSDAHGLCELGPVTGPVSKSISSHNRMSDIISSHPHPQVHTGVASSEDIMSKSAALVISLGTVRHPECLKWTSACPFRKCPYSVSVKKWEMVQINPLLMIRVSQEMGMWPTLLLDAPCDGDGGVNPDRHSRSHVLRSELMAPQHGEGRAPHQHPALTSLPARR